MILCFDIGGTSIKAAYAWSASEIHLLPKVPTPIDDFEAFVAILQVAKSASPEIPELISLSIAAVSDPETGVITCANIPCIDGLVLSEQLTRLLDCRVVIANDADCFAVAEAGLGAGQGHRIVFGIILGTGVGGGLVVDGMLVNADGGFAGEWGHGQALATSAGSPPVHIPHLPCGCGQKGCVDTFGAARGIERLHHHLVSETLSCEEIIAHWLEGKETAKRTLEIYIELISAPLALAVNITGASIVPVGGGLSNISQLLEALDSAVRNRILRKFIRPLVVSGICRPEPGLVGAALNGFQTVKIGLK